MKATRQRSSARPTNGANGLYRIGVADGRKFVPISSLTPSPENDLLYRARTPKDSDFARLVKSIRRNGVQAPLLVSLDRFIISGHQRLKAAIAAGLQTVPVIVLNLRHADHNGDELVAILREHNTGREKTFDELVREKLVDVKPDDAITQILNDEAERSHTRVKLIEIGEKEMKRSGISIDKQGMASAILEVLRDLESYLPVSLRAIHYRLLVKTFFRNLTKKTPYNNDLASYKDLSDLATRMRIAEQFPWDAICDETRPVTTWRIWRNASDFIADQCQGFLRGYARDLLQSQCQHFEVVVEKLTVKNFIDPIAGKYRMPVVVMRGNSGIDTRYQIAQRFRNSGKQKLFLFCLGDCDPDGDSIVDSTLRSLRDDFHIDRSRIDGTRVAMTHDQADELHLPRILEAKKKSSNYKAFVRKHGRSDCYELEAVAPEYPQEWLDFAIRGVIDIEAFNYEVQQQTDEAQGILARRQAVLEVMRQ